MRQNIADETMHEYLPQDSEICETVDKEVPVSWLSVATLATPLPGRQTASRRHPTSTLIRF